MFLKNDLTNTIQLLHLFFQTYSRSDWVPQKSESLGFAEQLFAGQMPFLLPSY